MREEADVTVITIQAGRESGPDLKQEAGLAEFSGVGGAESQPALQLSKHIYRQS